MLILGSIAERLCVCDWGESRPRPEVERRLCRFFDAEMVEGSSIILDKAKIQLDEYFAKTRRSFDLPMDWAGTPFQQSVWQALSHIDYGTTLTYAQVAAAVGRPRAVRAVAHAVGQNSLSVIVPCHRVIGTGGGLAGYAGGLDAKKMLLTIESTL